METMELGGILVGVSVFVFLGMVYPVLLLLTAGVGVALLLLGYLEQDHNHHRQPEPPDVVECPNCRGLESPERSTCRFCDESLAGARPK